MTTDILLRCLRFRPDHLGGVLHGHHAHAVGAGIGLDDDVRRVIDAVFAILGAHPAEHEIDVAGETLLAGSLVEVDLAAAPEDRVDQPRIDVDQLREFAGDHVIGGKVV